MKLTVTERLILRNQYLIMKATKSSDYTASQLDEMIEIVQAGYEHFYSDLISGLNEKGADPLVVQETMDILEMYRALDNAKNSGLTIPAKSHAAYVGFDGNNDPHYSVARFIIDTQGNYTESAPHRNSHSGGTLPTYRKMLGVWQSLSSKYALTQNDVNAILA